MNPAILVGGIAVCLLAAIVIVFFVLAPPAPRVAADRRRAPGVEHVSTLTRMTTRTTTALEGAIEGPNSAPRRPDRQVEGAQIDKLMQEAIASLEEDHRVLVVLRDLEDLSIEEICEITGLPDGTVKSRLHRARLALRKKIQRHL